MVEVTDANLLSDSTKFFRDLIINNVTDPITRTGTEKFVHTAFPTRDARWPIIVVQNSGFETRTLGMSTTGQMASLTFEAEVISQSVKERDSISQELWHDMRSNKDLMNASGLYDFAIKSMVNVDEEATSPNSTGIHRKVITWAVNHPSST